jgi:hypothetical protein
MPNFTSDPYTLGGNGRAYAQASGNYQVLYSTIAYTDLIPLHFNAYGQPEADGFGYKTPPQFPFRPQPIDMTPAQATVEPGADPNNLTNQLAAILCESFGIEPKGQRHIYQKPYPDYYDQLSYPRGYKVPEFSKFSGEDGKTTLEHVGQFILQCGEASTNDALKLRIFPLSLSGITFIWFTSLAPNSIFTWAQLEQKLDEYFYFGDTMLRLSHLTTIKQKHSEFAADSLEGLEIIGISVLI